MNSSRKSSYLCTFRTLLAGSAATVLLLSSTHALRAAPSSINPLQQSPICTTQLGEQIRVQFRNNTNAEVTVSVVGTTCQEEIRETILSDREVSVPSQVGQVWVLRVAGSNQLLKAVTIIEQHAAVLILAVGVDNLPPTAVPTLVPTQAPTLALPVPTATPEIVPMAIATAIPPQPRGKPMPVIWRRMPRWSAPPKT